MVLARFMIFIVMSVVGVSLFRTKLTKATKDTKELLERGNTLEKGYSNDYFIIFYFLIF
jgi:hypothetical protein